MLIEAGKISPFLWADGNWIFLDIGFSNKARSCGLLFGDAAPKEVTFRVASDEIIQWIKSSKTMVNLVVEAPLSVSFDSKGNPKRRKCEKEGKKTRYWYVGPGCAVMVAALYLIRGIYEAEGDGRVRLFEGFVSFKAPDSRSDGKVDVLALREIVRNPSKYPEALISEEQLREHPTDSLYSAFWVAGMDCRIPAVIKV